MTNETSDETPENRSNISKKNTQQTTNKPSLDGNQLTHDYSTIDSTSKLLNYNPENGAKHEDNDFDDAASDVSTESFTKTERVLLDGRVKAQVAYSGPVHFSYDDDWVGIVLDEASGKHNGSVAGTEYFKCEPLHGLFVRSHRLQRTDSLGHGAARVKSPFRLRPRSSANKHELESDMSDDLLARADQQDPLGFFEARAGTIRSPDQPNEKLGRLVDELDAGEAPINFSSPWLHSSRSPTPTNISTSRYSAPSTRRPMTAPSSKHSKPYSVTFGYGELDNAYWLCNPPNLQ